MTAGFGAFGKMPSLGDFFRLEVPQSFVDPWDRWLQEAILAARAALGARWQDSYFSAPIWRFSLAPGLAGPDAAAGIMMMSVDRVGRQFPLTLVQALPEGTDPLGWHLTAGALFAALEAVALDALEDAMTRERLAALLGALAVPVASGAEIRQEAGVLVVTGPGDILPGLAARGLRGAARHPSIWSAEVAGATRLMLAEGLPAGNSLLGLFDMEARVWTGRDAPAMRDEAAVVLPPAEADLPVGAARAPQAAAAVMPAHVPLDDPLADILGADDPLFGEDPDPGDDPLDAILSGTEPSADDAPPVPAPGAPQEA